MDVLAYHQPNLDWDRFRQGPLSDDVWAELRNLILLSHAYSHWRRAMREAQRIRPSIPLYKETAYQRRKSRDEWKRNIERHEGHMYRAAFLAAEKWWSIHALVSERENTADWHLGRALLLIAPDLLQTMTGHQRADFGRLSFLEFDGARDAIGDAESIVRAWASLPKASDTSPTSHR